LLNELPVPRLKPSCIPVEVVVAHVPVTSPGIVMNFCSQVFAELIV